MLAEDQIELMVSWKEGPWESSGVANTRTGDGSELAGGWLADQGTGLKVEEH